MGNNRLEASPKWGNTTKLVVALVFVMIIALIMTFYHTIVGPLLVALITSYLLYPIANFLKTKVRMPWVWAVNLIYIVFILILLTLVISGGVFLINQTQALIGFMQKSIKDLPAFLNDFASQKYYIGPFLLEVNTLDIQSIGNQLLGSLQNTIGQVGSLLGTIASSAAGMFGWGFFIVMISYFILSESRGAPEFLSHINMPGYEGDLIKLENELGKIWNAFLRGQLIITSLTMLFYVVILGGLGVQYFYVLAVVAGIARFIPYLGAWLSWTTFGLVAFFQGSTLFGMESLPYALLVVGLAIITDTIMDNIVTPRILSDALKVHPAAVMVAAIIGISWLGVIGVILAAPVLATLKLFMDYALYKLFDQNPWAGISSSNQHPSFSLRRDLSAAWNKIKEIFNLLFRKEKKVNR